jgi:hypothetical protein
VAAKPVTFGENEVREFENDEEDEDEEDEQQPPRLQVGEETKLQFDDEEEEEDAKSVDTETELMQKATDETVSLNL